MDLIEQLRHLAEHDPDYLNPYLDECSAAMLAAASYIEALEGGQTVLRVPRPAGYVVLCHNDANSIDANGWQPDWDGILYADYTEAVSELAKARRTYTESRLGVVSFVEGL